MTVSFNAIPDNIRVPLVYVEFDNSKAVQGTPQVMRKILVVGQMLATGQAEPLTPVRVLSADQAVRDFGRGSMLAAMFAALKKANKYPETWAIPMQDEAAGVAATGSITFAGPATEAGTVACWLAGVRVRAAVAAAATAEQAATALVAAINANLDLPVTAAVNGVDAKKVDITCRWKGETGNDVDIRFNYAQGEALPKGLTATIAAMSGGTANPDLADAIAVMGDEWWADIVCPYTDTTNLDALRTELLDRWGPMRQMDGIAWTAKRGTHGATGTFGGSRNDHLLTVMGTGTSPTPPWAWAAVNAVVGNASLANDPARPLQTLLLTGILPPAYEDRWTKEERNLLLYDGISTHTVDQGGLVRIERQITTYQTNTYGLDDPSYLDVETPATLGYIRYAVRARITQMFPRHKLANDGTKFAPGQAIATPSIVRDELCALFRELESGGLVEDFEQYKADLIVERNADDKNRLDVLMGPNLVNQLRIFAAQIQFIL